MATNRLTNFYIIQLEPEVDPERIKFGVAKNVRQRFNNYHITHFEAVLLAEWPIYPEDEAKTIAKMVKGLECEHVKGEVYDCFDIAGLMDRAAQHMPGRPVYLGDFNITEIPVSGRRSGLYENWKEVYKAKQASRNRHLPLNGMA